MSAFAGQDVSIFVQIPATQEMISFGASLSSALLKAEMKPLFQIINSMGNCQGDNGISLLSGQRRVQEAYVLGQELIRSGVMERQFPICIYGNEKDDARVTVWITRP
jgi:hypothetical protein